MMRKIFAGILACGLMVGCSGGGGSSDSSNDEVVNDGSNQTNETPTTSEGRAADGYLVGATVCLDLNNNRACDEGEPSTQTLAGGEFSLSDITVAQKESSNLVVEVVPGVTIDEDSPEAPVEKSYSLIAPSGYSFVSPLTTFVVSVAEQDNISVEEAAARLKEELGTTIELNEDYIAGIASGQNVENFEKLHRVAQVSRVLLENNLEAVKSISDTASFGDVLSIAIDQVVNNLANVLAVVESAGEDFDPNAAAADESLDDANVDLTEVQELLTELENIRNSSEAQIVELLVNGDVFFIHDTDTEEDPVTLFRSKLAQSDGVIGFNYQIYDPDGASWVDFDTNLVTDKECILEVDGQWNCVSSIANTITAADGVLRVQLGDANHPGFTVIAKEQEVGERRIAIFAGELARYYDPDARFNSGANVYRMTLNYESAEYTFESDNVATATDCFEGADAEQPYNPTDGHCNNIYLVTGDGNHENDGAAVQSYSDLISTSAAVDPETRADIRGFDLFAEDFSIAVELLAGGRVNYYFSPYVDGSVEKITTGFWNEDNVSGTQVLKLPLPRSVSQFYHDDTELFLADFEGFTRLGTYIEPGAVEDEGWVFNGPAEEDIEINLNFALGTDLEACAVGDSQLDLDGDPSANANIEDYLGTIPNCIEGGGAFDAFVAEDIAEKQFAVDDELFQFNTDGTGTVSATDEDGLFQLEFTWSINELGLLHIEAEFEEEDTAIVVDYYAAKVDQTARQLSLKTLFIENVASDPVPNLYGSIESEIWDIAITDD